MKSRTEIKRDVVMAGGTIDDAYRVIHARELFVLRHKNGSYLKAVTRSNKGAEFAGENTVELWANGTDALEAWHTTDAEKAEFVRLFPPPWYNSGSETPTHGFQPEELYVEQMVVIAPAKVEVKIPTVEEYLTRCYGPEGREPNAQHLKFCLEMLARGELTRYEWPSYSLLKIDEAKRSKKTAIPDSPTAGGQH